MDRRLHGVRIRKNFKTREEAIAEKATQELKALQADAGLQSATTFLSEEQLREAETAFNRLKEKPRSLSFYLDFALSNYREPEIQKLLSEAVPAYTEAKDHEFAQDQISAPQLERIKRDLKRLLKHFPKLAVAELTAERLIGFSILGNPRSKPTTTGVASSRPSSSLLSSEAGSARTRLPKCRITGFAESAEPSRPSRPPKPPS